MPQPIELLHFLVNCNSSLTTNLEKGHNLFNKINLLVSAYFNYNYSLTCPDFYKV